MKGMDKLVNSSYEDKWQKLESYLKKNIEKSKDEEKRIYINVLSQMYYIDSGRCENDE